MALRPREILFLFAIVAAGTTVYLDHAVPFVWKSPLWFPLGIGLGTVAVGLLRGRLGLGRAEFDPRIGLGAFAAVIAIYSTISVAGDDGVASVALVASLAALVACFVADRAGVLCGLAAALVGPAVEIAIVKLDLSEYTAANDSLFGVGLWLPALYFAFGVAVARITELLVARRTG